MAITVVHTTTASTLSVTIPSTTAGNCLVVCISTEDFSGTTVQSVSGVTLGGSAGNFAQLAASALAGANVCASFIWADPNCAGGQTAIVISGSNLNVATTAGGVTVYEISGLTASSVLDQSSTSIGASATYTSGTTPTTTQASEIVIGCINFFDTLSTSPAGYTNSTFTFGITGYKIVSATGAYVYSATQSPSGNYAGAVVALKAAPAVTFDAVGPSSSGAVSTGSASLSWSHVNAGNALIAAVAVGSNPDTGLTLAATYGGVAMAAGAVVHAGLATTGYLQVFTLLNPPAGTNTVAVTMSGGTPSTGMSGGSISCTLAGGFRAQYSATGVSVTTATVTSSGSTSGSLICAFVADGSGTTSATSPSTSRFLGNNNTLTAAGNIAGATSPGTGSNVTTAWTISSDDCALIAVEILPAAAAAIPLRPLPGQVTVMRASVY